MVPKFAEIRGIRGPKPAAYNAQSAFLALCAHFCGKSPQVPLHEAFTHKIGFFKSCPMVSNRVIFTSSTVLPRLDETDFLGYMEAFQAETPADPI